MRARPPCRCAGRGASDNAGPLCVPGLVTLPLSKSLVPARMSEALAQHPPIFAREISIGTGPLALGERDRITPIVDVARQIGVKCGSLWLEFPDTNDGKQLSPMCRRLEPLLRDALRDSQLITVDDHPRLPRLRCRIHVEAARLCGDERPRLEFLVADGHSALEDAAGRAVTFDAQVSRSLRRVPVRGRAVGGFAASDFARSRFGAAPAGRPAIGGSRHRVDCRFRTERAQDLKGSVARTIRWSRRSVRGADSPGARNERSTARLRHCPAADPHRGTRRALDRRWRCSTRDLRA